MAPVVEVPHLVVGAGPVGLTAAQLLARADRRCLVVDRRDGPLRHPAAHVVNARTLEIFRQCGLDMDAIGAIAKDPADAGHVNFVTRLDGELIGRLPFERQGTGCLALTPTPLRNISQHHLEPILSQAVQANAAADVRYRCEWVSSVQDADGVTSVVRDLDTGDELEVRSRYLLAADGAGSGVRKSLGIEMLGPASLESFIAIHFAADLRPIVAERPGVLHFVMDPAVTGVFVAHDIDREWVFMVTFDPTQETVDDYDPSRCREIVRGAIGAGSDAAVEILDAGSWHMSAQVAERMRDGRIFLVGDAAHRFPPTGGLGLNTGVADAHGLAWKLSAVQDGWADPAILDTYEQERRPVAELNCEQSTTNALKMITLIDALGLTTSSTTDAMNQTLADPANREAVDAAVAEQATHFDMIGLQLGYRYDHGALVPGERPPQVDDPSRFEPDAAPGSRLPHAWTLDGRSTLDLVESDALTLFSFGAHDEWAAAAAAVGPPVQQVAIRAGVEVDDGWRMLCRLEPDGALLVRPDHHIAWRADSAAVGLAELPIAVDRVLHP